MAEKRDYYVLHYIFISEISVMIGINMYSIMIFHLQYSISLHIQEIIVIVMTYSACTRPAIQKMPPPVNPHTISHDIIT